MGFTPINRRLIEQPYRKKVAIRRGLTVTPSHLAVEALRKQSKGHGSENELVVIRAEREIAVVSGTKALIGTISPYVAVVNGIRIGFVEAVEADFLQPTIMFPDPRKPTIYVVLNYLLNRETSAARHLDVLMRRRDVTVESEESATAFELPDIATQKSIAREYVAKLEEEAEMKSGGDKEFQVGLLWSVIIYRKLYELTEQHRKGNKEDELVISTRLVEAQLRYLLTKAVFEYLDIAQRKGKKDPADTVSKEAGIAATFVLCHPFFALSEAADILLRKARPNDLEDKAKIEFIGRFLFGRKERGIGGTFDYLNIDPVTLQAFALKYLELTYPGREIAYRLRIVDRALDSITRNLFEV